MTINKKTSAPKERLLGKILVERDVITQSQLDQAVESQTKTGGRIGDVLLRLGFVEERDIVAALVVQLHIPYIGIDKYEVDPNIFRLLPVEIMRKYQLIPLDRVSDILSVVMADPLDEMVKAEIHRLTNCRLVPFIATRTEIEKAIQRLSGNG